MITNSSKTVFRLYNTKTKDFARYESSRNPDDADFCNDYSYEFSSYGEDVYEVDDEYIALKCITYPDVKWYNTSKEHPMWNDKNISDWVVVKVRITEEYEIL